jgi:hypothetical protein
LRLSTRSIVQLSFEFRNESARPKLEQNVNATPSNIPNLPLDYLGKLGPFQVLVIVISKSLLEW